MNRNYNKCLELVLHHEGGFVNHPKDPGGATNMGITKRTYEDFHDSAVSVDRIRELTYFDVEPIYRIKYWEKAGCDHLPSGIDLMVFDFAVNAGVSRSTRYLQHSVGAVPDGVVGPNTIKAVRTYIESNSAAMLIRLLAKKRMEYYRSLHHFSAFGAGWTNRTYQTQSVALEMCK